MERFLGFILGIAALALYGPFLVFGGTEPVQQYGQWLLKTLGQGWFQGIFQMGPGVFAGLALLLAIVILRYNRRSNPTPAGPTRASTAPSTWAVRSTRPSPSAPWCSATANTASRPAPASWPTACRPGSTRR
mgnify:CR=1 FL=1